MLCHSADVRTVIYIVGISTLLAVQWSMPQIEPVLVLASCVMAVSVPMIAHNHNHAPMWRSRTLNRLTDYWLTLFYGMPAFVWIPTHNMNHHRFINGDRDLSSTWQLGERNDLVSLVSYPLVSGVRQMVLISDFLRERWATKRRRAWFYISQIALLMAFVGVALALDWRKALLLVVLPQQVALTTVLLFNYLQHVHADETSEIDHSRNFTGRLLNGFLFNSGFHTAHHKSAGIHWSETPAMHAAMAGTMHPSLIQPSLAGFLFRTYVLGSFDARYRSKPLGRPRGSERIDTGLAASPVHGDTRTAAERGASRL